MADEGVPLVLENIDSGVTLNNEFAFSLQDQFGQVITTDYSSQAVLQGIDNASIQGVSRA